MKDDILLTIERYNQARRLIELGARVAMVTHETGLIHSRVVRLAAKVTGQSPSKGQVPSNPKFFTSRPNYNQASLYLNAVEFLKRNNPDIDRVDLLIKAFEVYFNMVRASGCDAVMSITRTWILHRYFDSGLVSLVKCKKCQTKMLHERVEMGALSPSGFTCKQCGSFSKRTSKASNAKELPGYAGILDTKSPRTKDKSPIQSPKKASSDHHFANALNL